MRIKIDEYLDIKNCFCEKLLIGRLVLEREDEILNTTENLLNDKKVARGKSNCLISYYFSYYFIGNLCLLLLAVICVSCHIYYTKYRPKQKHFLLFNNTVMKLAEIFYQNYIIKTESNDKFKKYLLKIVRVIILVT